MASALSPGLAAYGLACPIPGGVIDAELRLHVAA
jgi:hypothetical protein